MIAFRYLVKDVDVSIQFYTEFFGFKLEQQYGSAMAILTKDDSSLWLAGPMSSAGQAMPDGSKPVPGGWNRIVIAVEGLEDLVSELTEQGVRFKNELTSGPGGAQILCEDPSGNVIELFQLPQ